MLSKLPETVLVWISNRQSYVENTPGTILRIKNASKFGENQLGFKDQAGNLVELKWNAIFKLRPTQIEINHGRNPLPELVELLDANYEQEQISEFFELVKVLSIQMSDVSSQSLLKLLEKFSLLAAFSYSEVDFNTSEWYLITKRLAQLNLRAIEISTNILNSISQNLHISLLKLTGNPGINVNEFKKGIEFVTVNTLVVQELLFTGNSDAEQFLEVLPISFPRLQNLIWDWNTVDPEVTDDNRTTMITKQLSSVYQTLKLNSLAIIAYTPSAKNKSAFDGIARNLNSSINNVQLHRFASKGLSNDSANFSLITSGENERIENELIEMYVKDRSTMPPLGKLLRICDEEIVPIFPAVTIDFGGFDKDKIKQLAIQSE